MESERGEARVAEVEERLIIGQVRTRYKTIAMVQRERTLYNSSRAQVFVGSPRFA